MEYHFSNKKSFGKKIMPPTIAAATDTMRTAPAAVSFIISARLSYSVNRASHNSSIDVLNVSAAKTIPMHSNIAIHSNCVIERQIPSNIAINVNPTIIMANIHTFQINSFLTVQPAESNNFGKSPGKNKVLRKKVAALANPIKRTKYPSLGVARKLMPKGWKYSMMSINPMHTKVMVRRLCLKLLLKG